MAEITFSEERPASEQVRYNHVVATTPLGEYTIIWKGWKDYDPPWIDGPLEFGESADDVPHAKELIMQHLKRVRDSLIAALPVE